MRTMLVLAFATAAVLAQESQSPPPRQTFERAAYAEEHDRDFAKAAELYREAGSVALFLGDDKLATEAKIALKRVEGRMGKAAGTQPSQEAPLAVQRRLFLLVKHLSSPPQDGNDTRWDTVDKILPFGSAAVPILEKALRADIIQDPDMAAPFRGDSTWAAKALARLRVPEASAALLNGVKSPDPFVKGAVLSEVNLTNHRPVLEQALEDPNPAIVAKAIAAMSRSNEPSVAPLMEASLTRNDEGGAAAGAWVARHEPAEVNALLENPEALSKEKPMSDNAFQGMVDAYLEGGVDASEIVRALVEAAERTTIPFRRRVLLGGLASLVSRGRFGPAVTGFEEIRNRVETLVLQQLERGEPKNDVDAWSSLLTFFGRRRTADFLLKSLREGRVPPHQIGNLVNFISGQISDLGPTEFKRAVEMALAVFTAQPQRQDQMFNALISLARKGKGVLPDDLVAGYELMPPGSRERYLTRLVMSVEKPPVSLLREAVALGASYPRRSEALEKMIWAGDPSTLDDAAREIFSTDSNMRRAADNLFAAVAPRDPAKALAIIERRLLNAEPATLDHLVYAATALPPTDIVPMFERLWKDASAERREVLVQILLGYPADAPHPLTVAFLAKHFEEIARPDFRAQAINRFNSAIYEPAMDVIGGALRDPTPSVREAARSALEAFRKQREALEEFSRWKTGDAEGRKSYAELVKLLDSPNVTVVEGAVRALGAIKAKGALPAIVKVLERPGVTPDLKAAVDEAIKKIGE